MNQKFGWWPLLMGIFFSLASKAQHCPFDGLYTIAIQIKPAVKKSKQPVFYLAEKEGNRKDTCSFTNSVDSMRFNNEKQVHAALKADPRSTRSRYLPQRLKSDFNFLKGNQVVFLSMSAKDCMVARGNEYEYVPRNFVIRYSYGGKEWEVAVPVESIFSMCGAKGSWRRIEAMVIELEKGVGR
jgi:hypothetical protein